MGSLANKAIKNSYGDLLQVSNNNSGIDGTVRSIEDGEGTVSPLGLSDTTIEISGHIIPSANAQFDLGNAENKIRHLFLSDNSLYIGDTTISETDATNIKGLDDGTYVKSLSGFSINDLMTQLYTKPETAPGGYDEPVDKSMLIYDVDASDGNFFKYNTSKSIVIGALDIDNDSDGKFVKWDNGSNTFVWEDMPTTYSTTEIDTALAAKADSTALGDYTTTADMNTALAAKADASSVPTFSYNNGVLNITTS